MSQPRVLWPAAECPAAECPVAEVLAAGGAALGERDLVSAARGLSAPVRVQVTGRPGSGRSTVSQVLGAAGVHVTGPEISVPEVLVYVFVERLTPEDRAAVSAADRPCVAVLNKADLAGFRGAGPMAAATARCHALEPTIGAPIVPFAALVALAVLDGTLSDALFDGLTVLAGGGSVPLVSPQISPRLLADLDLFGVATAVAALRSGARRAAVAEELRRVSGIDAVLAELGRVTAEVRYRRATMVLASLAGRAAGPPGGPIAELICSDALVEARMASAAAVVRAAGLPVDCGRTAAEHLRAAVDWQRYAAGPVSELHRACGTDIARGSLRLWARA